MSLIGRNDLDMMVISDGINFTNWEIDENANDDLEFNENGTNRLILKSGGNVGIGTNSPSQLLDVAGNINATGNLAVDTDTLYVDATNDRVGINQASPQQKLHIVDTSAGNITTPLRLDNYDGTIGSGCGIIFNVISSEITTGQIYNINNSSGDYSLVLSDFFGSLSNQLHLRNSNVGIGDTNPSEKLSVTGNAKISGNLAIDTDTLYVETINDRVGVNTNSPSEALDVVGNINATGNLVATNLTGTLQTAAQPNITSVGTLTDLAISGGLDIGTATGTYGTFNRQFNIVGTDAVVKVARLNGGSASPAVELMDLSVDGNTRTGYWDFYVDSGKFFIRDRNNSNRNVLTLDGANQRVGINNTTPTEALDVTGNAKISGNLAVDTNTLYVDSTNNNVAIGYATPFTIGGDRI